MMVRRTTMLGVLLLGAAAAAAPAVDQNDAIMSAKGLAGVGLVIDGLPERSSNPAVLTQEAVTADAQEVLQRAGIRLLSAAEWKALPAQPHIQISIGGQHTPSDTYFDVVMVALRQRATLASGQNLAVDTWTDAATGRSDGTNHVERLQALAKEEVARFANLWRVANR
jgi:hypothetical protein